MSVFRWSIGLLILGACCLSVPLAAGQTKDNPQSPTSVPVPGTFPLYLVQDQRFNPKDERNREGKIHCLVNENGLFTVIAVFSRRIPKDESDPVIALMRKQQELATRYRSRRLGVFTGFLSLYRAFEDDETRDTIIQEAKNAARSANVPLVPVGIAPATTTVPLQGRPTKQEEDAARKELKVDPVVEAWGIGKDDEVTVIVYDRFKVVQRWAFTKDNPPAKADLDKLEQVIEEVMTRKR